MRAFSSDRFVLPLPSGHRFPMAKYRLLREAILARGLVAEGELETPDPVRPVDVLRVHEAAYWQRVTGGSLSPAEVRRLGFPWSEALVERSLRSVGATLAAARAALDDGGAVNLAGGTHHAFADRGEGYCVLNDVAIAIRVLQAEGRITQSLVVDCDVHQGNGTARIFAADPTVFTLSLHGARNYPFHKERSDLDVPLPDGCEDEAYLRRLAEALDEAMGASRPEIVFYLAGADPWRGDRLGRLGLTRGGLRLRDRLVFSRCRALGVPVAVAMAGGYAREVRDTVAIHAATVEELAATVG